MKKLVFSVIAPVAMLVMLLIPFGANAASSPTVFGVFKSADMPVGVVTYSGAQDVEVAKYVVQSRKGHNGAKSYAESRWKFSNAD